MRFHDHSLAPLDPPRVAEGLDPASTKGMDTTLLDTVVQVWDLPMPQATRSWSDPGVVVGAGSAAKTACFDLRNALERSTGVRMEALSLGRPSQMHGLMPFFTGTNTPGGGGQCFLCMDGDPAIRRNPILSIFDLGAHPYRCSWPIHQNMVAVATDADITLLNVADDHGMTMHARLPPLFLDTRAIAVNQANRAQAAMVIGGHFALVDLENPDRFRSTALDSPCTSVAWPLCNLNQFPSLTKQNGEFLIHDLRTWPGEVAYRATTRPGPTSHVRPDDHHFILGYDDGSLLQGDVRMERIMPHLVRMPGGGPVTSMDGSTPGGYPGRDGRVVVGGPRALTVLEPRPESLSAYDVVFHRGLDPVEGAPVLVYAVSRDNGELIDCTSDGRVRITTPRAERRAGPAAPPAP